MWEYITVKTKTDWGFVQGRSLDCQELNDNLNSLGAEGWELTTAFDINSNRGASTEVVLIFKRRAS